jgi:hypothetical protein
MILYNFFIKSFSIDFSEVIMTTAVNWSKSISVNSWI